MKDAEIKQSVFADGESPLKESANLKLDEVTFSYKYPLKAQIERGINTDEIAEPNSLAIEGTIAAYTKGGPWLTALKKRLSDNQAIVIEFLTENLPLVDIVPSEATYLMWINVHKITSNAESLATFIHEQTGLYLNVGNVYGGNGQQFLRLNVATQEVRLKDGLNRLVIGIERYIDQDK